MNLNKTESNIWEHHIGAFLFQKTIDIRFNYLYDTIVKTR